MEIPILSSYTKTAFNIEKYKGVAISGDFFCFPRDSVDRLAALLEDCAAENVSNLVSDF